MVALPDGFSVRRVPFREAPDDDLAALHLIEAEVEVERRPDRLPQPLETYVAFARAFPGHYDEWTWLVEAGDGSPVATGIAWYRQGDDPNVIHVDFMVRSSWRRLGIAAHLVTLVCGVATDRGRTLLTGSSHDSVGGADRFAERFGGRAGSVARDSELRFDAVDWSMVARWVAEGLARATGYTLEWLDGPYPPSLLDDAVIFHDIMETAPRDDLAIAHSTIEPGQIADWDRAAVESGRWRWIILVRDPKGVCVGGTEMAFEPWDPTIGLQGNTGIDPAHRGMGLGKWVKAAMLQRLRDERPDITRARTGNAYSNAPMLAINDTLGFKVIQSRTDWQTAVADVVAALAGGRSQVS